MAPWARHHDAVHLPLASARVAPEGRGRDVFFTAPCPTYSGGRGPGGPSPRCQLQSTASRGKRTRGGPSHFQPGPSIGSWPATGLPGVLAHLQEEDNAPAVGTRPGSGSRSLDSGSDAGTENSHARPRPRAQRASPCRGVRVPHSPQLRLRWCSYNLGRESLPECPGGRAFRNA